MHSKYQKMIKELTVVFSEYYLNYLLYDEIAKKFAISKSAMSQVLPKLEALNFIKHEANPNIHSEYFIGFAEEGLAYQTLSKEADKEFMTKHFADIDLEQLQNVLQTMKIVNASISSSDK